MALAAGLWFGGCDTGSDTTVASAGGPVDTPNSESTYGCGDCGEGDWSVSYVSTSGPDSTSTGPEGDSTTTGSTTGGSESDSSSDSGSDSTTAGDEEPETTSGPS